MSRTNKQRKTVLGARGCALTKDGPQEAPLSALAVLDEQAQPGKNDDILTCEHWVPYTSPNTMSQETSVPARYTLRYVAKELVDNALDWTDRHVLPGAVTVRLEGTHTIVVANEGPGWDRIPEEYAQIFSLARGSLSSKLARLPTRGAAGLGIKAITGAAASGGGSIQIKSCNRQTVLRPRIDNGRTDLEEVTEIDKPTGTEITVEVDPAYPADPGALVWAETAIQLARQGNKPPRLERTSVHWFDTDAFTGLLYAQPPETTLQQFLTHFQGTSDRRLQQEIDRRFGLKTPTRQLSRAAAAELLAVLQHFTESPKARRLGTLGRQAWPDYPDGYALQTDFYITGARFPHATIPCVAECWAITTSSAEPEVRPARITINRTPTFIHASCWRRPGRQRRSAILELNGTEIPLSLPCAWIEFVLNLTLPFVPILSSGKLADFHPFRDVIKKTVEQAVKRAYRATRQSSKGRVAPLFEGSPPQAGKLHRVLSVATERGDYTVEQLTVLSEDKDPYRLDSVAKHVVGRWCAQMVDRFLPERATIHLRGFHYVLTSPGDVTRPDSHMYINNDNMWEWLSERAMKAARWLGYVPFERIIDERNAPPELCLPPYYQLEPERSGGERILFPGLDKAVPGFTSPAWPVVQPYRIILLGEKVSLRPILLPIAQMVGGELLLPTGEISDTLIYDLAARCAQDSRPSVILYFSDFDPGGHQMPVSVSRKLQALHDLLFPKLNIQLYPVALTLAQVRELGLPSTPLKETEKRAERWREIMGHEQTEIDALAALQPDVLEAIAREAIQPFYDATLAKRTAQAERDWQAQSKDFVATQPAFAQARCEIELSVELIERSAQKLHQLQDRTALILENLQPPPITLPLATIQDDRARPKPLFDSREDFVTTSRRLHHHKQYKPLT